MQILTEVTQSSLVAKRLLTFDEFWEIVRNRRANARESLCTQWIKN